MLNKFIGGGEDIVVTSKTRNVIKSIPQTFSTLSLACSMISGFLHRFSIFYYRFIATHQFRKLGVKVSIICPLKIDGAENIILHDGVVVNYKTWLAAQPLTGENSCVLEIGTGTILGHFNHIYATSEIRIGKNVLTADKVYISDNLHGYEDIHTPIMFQPIQQKKGVSIGDGSWIGENVCIIGASIGKNCVIGANSVVTKNIPDYSIAVGAPARIIKQYSFSTNSWQEIRP